ncbi:MAG TPA: hypothetical protein VKO42_03725 [Patescibacteria group bacterium]|nr:hypothetical protein [Patescibacteria group bacterium]
MKLLKESKFNNKEGQQEEQDISSVVCRTCREQGRDKALKELQKYSPEERLARIEKEIFKIKKKIRFLTEQKNKE